MSAVVRVAERRDASELLFLLQASDQGSHVRTTASDLESCLAREGTERIFVTQLAERLIGYAAVQITESFAYARPTAELTELFVLPSYRRMGVGRKLIAAAIAYSVERKALEFFARVNRKNLKAIALYEIAGLKQTDHHEYRLTYY